MNIHRLQQILNGQQSLARWQRTLVILFIAQSMVAVGFSSIFPFLPLYVKDLGTNTDLSIEVLSGLVFSSQAFTMMLASPLWGMVADRFGRKLMVQRSMFGGAAILLLMAFVRSAEELVLLRAIQGLITGTVAAANALVAAEAPRNRSGFAMGFLQTGLGSGLAVGPLIGGAVADAFGYNAAFYVTAAMLLLAGVMVHFGVHEEFTPPEKSSRASKNILATWKDILRAPGVALTYSLRFSASLGQMMIVPIAPLFIATLMTDQSGLNTITGLSVGMSSGASTLSAIYLGRLGDRIGHRRIVIASTAALCLIYLPYSLVTAPWQLLILQGFAGTAIGGVTTSITALLAHFTAINESGAVYGLDNSIGSGARSLAPMVGAWVALGFGLRGTFVATAVLFLLACLFALLWLPDKTRLVAQAQLNETAR